MRLSKRRVRQADRLARPVRRSSSGMRQVHNFSLTADAKQVVEQVSAYQTAAFFAQRAGHAQPGDLAELLKPLPDRLPVEGDELPG